MIPAVISVSFLEADHSLLEQTPWRSQPFMPPRMLEPSYFSPGHSS